MKTLKKSGMTLKDVSGVYSGPEGRLWELLMGEQIHAGGWKSSMELAHAAGIRKGMKVLDLCSALGAGLRFLVKNFDVRGYGLEGTEHMHTEAIRRAREEGLHDRIELVYGNVMNIPWADATFDAVWGEDAWCYVEDKEQLIAEASRVLKPGGIIAFTDWIEGTAGLTDEEAERINSFMKFPYMETMEGYAGLLGKYGFVIKQADDLTEEFAGYIDLYINMATRQLTYDVLKILGNDVNMLQAIGAELQFAHQLAVARKFGKGRWIAMKE